MHLPKLSFLAGLAATAVAIAQCCSNSEGSYLWKDGTGSWQATVDLKSAICATDSDTLAVQVVLDGNAVHELCHVRCNSIPLQCSSILSGVTVSSVSSAVVYSLEFGTGRQPIANKLCDLALREPPAGIALPPLRNSTVLSTSASELKVGILYEGWHTFAATAMANVTAVGGTQLTVEDVIRSNGNLQLSQILDKYNLRCVRHRYSTPAACDSFGVCPL